MASGKTHRTISILLAPIAAGTAWFSWHGFGLTTTEHVGVALATLVGCLATVAIQPDLDQAEGWRPGTTGKKLWKALWFMYGRMTKHREWTSHFPVIGTLGRLIYLAWLPGPLWALVPHVVLPQIAFLLIMQFVYGMIIGDTGHWVADTCP